METKTNDKAVSTFNWEVFSPLPNATEYSGVFDMSGRGLIYVGLNSEGAAEKCKLIASAPKLLEALQYIVLWGKVQGKKFIFDCHTEKLDEIISAINAATQTQK